MDINAGMVEKPRKDGRGERSTALLHRPENHIPGALGTSSLKKTKRMGGKRDVVRLTHFHAIARNPPERSVEIQFRPASTTSLCYGRCEVVVDRPV